jgi:glycosyltransferase involved in cell wall biosynthesis
MPEGVVMTIIGDGPLRKILENSAKGGALNGKMQFLGWVPHTDVVAYMHAADVYIMPSDEEGFPHTLLEAMALGTPFVATAVGGVSEIVPPSVKSLLVPRGDMALFVKRLAEVLALPAGVRSREASETPTWVGRYDTHVVLEQFVKMVTRL